MHWSYIGIIFVYADDQGQRTQNVEDGPPVLLLLLCASHDRHGADPLSQFSCARVPTYDAPGGGLAKLLERTQIKAPDLGPMRADPSALHN
ncbi:hypothetical protein PV325_003178 [Microctonus aethiopoides]|nr:hypothetical protein PV325_003178 [Microctonus aethiopoides]